MADRMSQIEDAARRVVEAYNAPADAYVAWSREIMDSIEDLAAALCMAVAVRDVT